MNRSAPANIDAIRRVARALGDLGPELVYVGGAVVELLLADPASGGVRPTRDVDVVVRVSAYSDYVGSLTRRLHRRGIHEDPEKGAPLCRWIAAGVKLDVIPSEPGVLGFSNPWFPAALETAVLRKDLPRCPPIRVVAPACFLATKLVAFRSRGEGDFLASEDIEDFVAVVDGRPDVVDEIRGAPAPMRAWLVEGIRGLVADRRFQDALPGMLPPSPAGQARLGTLRERLDRIASLTGGSPPEVVPGS